MTLSRRELLTGPLPFVGLCSWSSSVAAAMPAPAEMPSRLWLVHDHDGTEIVTTFRNAGGYDRDAILELSWLWRDNEDGRAIWIEPRLFDALARLHAEGRARLTEGSRFVGAFRACGIAIPVFELAEGETADDVAKDAAAFAAALEEALAETTPLSPEERRARQGLVSRQVTIR